MTYFIWRLLRGGGGGGGRWNFATPQKVFALPFKSNMDTPPPQIFLKEQLPIHCYHQERVFETLHKTPPN